MAPTSSPLAAFRACAQACSRDLVRGASLPPWPAHEPHGRDREGTRSTHDAATLRAAWAAGTRRRFRSDGAWDRYLLAALVARRQATPPTGERSRQRERRKTWRAREKRGSKTRHPVARLAASLRNSQRTLPHTRLHDHRTRQRATQAPKTRAHGRRSRCDPPSWRAGSRRNTRWMGVRNQWFRCLSPAPRPPGRACVPAAGCEPWGGRCLKRACRPHLASRWPSGGVGR